MNAALAPTKYLLFAIILKDDFLHVIPTLREKICLSAKFYVILNIIPSDINIRSLMSSEEWQMVKSMVAHRGHAIHFF